MFVTYPDVCWCQLISPSITGLRHYRSGCVSIPCAGPPTSAATRPTTHARAGPTPHRRFHKLCRASNRAATTHISSCLPHASLNPGQNSPASICLHPKREKLSLHAQNSPNSTLLGEQGEFCHGHAPKFLDRARSVRPQAVRSHVNPLAHTSTGYSIDGRAPHTGPARPGCGARGRWRGLAGLRDRSLRAKLACGDLAGGPPPTGTQSSPAVATGTQSNPAVATGTQSNPAVATGTQSNPAVATGRPRAHKAARRLHEHITRPRPVSRPRPRQ